MRKLVTAAAAALTLSAMGLAAPAFADHQDDYRRPQADRPYQGQDDFRLGPAPSTPGYQDYDDDGYKGDRYRDDRYRDDRYRGDGWRDRNYNFDRFNGRFDSWERGWRHENRWGPRHGQTLNYWQIVRRLERQGFYGVRGLRPARFGWGWRAFAFTGRGQPVMLRVNPYTGRVIDVRYV